MNAPAPIALSLLLLVSSVARAETPAPVDLESLALSLRELEYEISGSNGSFRAPNRAQDLRATFTGDGVAVCARTGPAEWSWSWETVAWGRPGSMRAAGHSTREAEGNRVEFHFGDDLTEWWINRPDGLEQGFTVPRAPGGAGALVLRGRGPDGLAADPVEGGLAFRATDAPMDSSPLLLFDRLKAFDATGRELPSEMSWDDGFIELRIDDAGAEYPLDIDPVLTKYIQDPTPPSQFGATVGFSVHTAGDVNADGFSDFLVGAPGWDNGLLANTGRVFLFRGASIGIEPTPVWDAISIAPLANFGHCVSTAGDVNGDGYDDVIIGAPYYNNGSGDEGRVYLYYGTSAPGGYLQGSPAWSTASAFADSHYGWSVAGAGDVNGDGYDDVLVGAPDYEGFANPTNSGAAYLYLGSASGPGAAPADAFFGASAAEYLGYCVSTAGDVNSDGLADVVIGAPRARNNANAIVGKAYVYRGDGGGVEASPVTLLGNQTNAWFGASVHLAGDVDGDGYGDVVVGQPYFDGTAGTDCGRATVYRGGAAGISTSVGWAGEGGTAEELFGFCVSAAGDVDGNSFADFLVGSPDYSGGHGRARVYLGSWTFPSLTGQLITGTPSPGDEMGRSVASAGDVNGDGFSDVLLGFPYANGGSTDEGRVELWMGGARDPGVSLCDGSSGSTSRPIGRSGCIADVNGDGYSDWLYQAGDGEIDVHPGDEDWIVPNPILQTIVGPTGVGFGEAMASAGDVNGDGYEDVVVGAPREGPNEEGAFYVFYGSPSGLQTPAGTHILHPDGMQAHFGFSVAAAGDYDNDGFADVMVGGPLWGGNNEGTARIMRGSYTGLITHAFKLYLGSQSGMQLGYSVSGAGDWNADGYADYAIGAPFYDFGGIESGLVALYLGGETVTFAGSRTGPQDAAGFGKALTFAPDMDGDGHSELIVGLPEYDFLAPLFNDTGAIFVYDGADSSLSPVAKVSTDVGARFGASLACAGDIDVDGYSDLAVGSPGYNYTPQGETGNGRVQLLFGRSGTWYADPAVDVEIGISTGDSLGFWLANGGDLNGDGFAEYMVTAPFANNGPELNTGTVLVPHGSNYCHGTFSYRLRQLTTGGQPIAWRGLAEDVDAFRIQLRGRSAGGRLPQRLELQLAEVGGSLGSGIAFGYQEPTGALAVESEGMLFEEDIFGLAPETGHHWRARLHSRSPYFPNSLWLTPAPGIPSFKSFRTRGGPTGAPEIAAAPSVGLRLDSVHPNPSRSATSVAFSLDRKHRVTVDVIDVTGRRVATVADRPFESGRHEVQWDGRNRDGAGVAAGVYYVRIAAGDVAEARSVTMLR